MKIDLHIHTNFSCDGFSSPKEVVDSAIEKNIDCICITDHGQIKGALEAIKYAFDKNILVIPGIEVSTDYGELLGINIKREIVEGLPFAKAVKEIQKQGGIAVIPHPFAWPAAEFLGVEKDILLADAIEIFNAHIFNFSNKKAFIFSQKHRLAFTAGSDAHKAKFVGRGYWEIQKENLSEKEILEEIKKRVGQAKGVTLNILETIENGAKVKLLPYLKNYYRLKSASQKLKN